MSPRSRTVGLASMLMLIAMLGVSGCDGESWSPTGPGDPSFVLAKARVSVDGTTYNGGTFRQGQGHGSSTRFEARLFLEDGRPAAGQEVWVTYRHGGGMMGTGRFRMLDDGSHCGHPPGLGMYCFEDRDGHHGFHHQGAHHGRYRFHFQGHHRDGRKSNSAEVVVDVGR